MKSPRGAATVSGEHHPRRRFVAGSHCRSTGRREGDRARIREPGYLAARARYSNHRRANTPKGGPVRSSISGRRLSPLILAVTILSTRPASAATVTGRVIDPASRPVPGAQILVMCGQRLTATAVTDAEGRFRIDDAQGTCELRVGIQGFAASPVPLELAEGSTVVDAGTVALEVSAVSESVVVSAAQVDVPTLAGRVIGHGHHRSGAPRPSVHERSRMRFAKCPGMSVVRTGSVGALTSVFPRGGESDYSLVLIDDVPANAFGGGFDFSHLAADDIDRIEIVRGPQSALFGSNAIGAVVRVITRTGGPLRGGAAVEGGSFNTSRLAASSSGSADGWFWGAGVERFATDNANGTADPGRRGRQRRLHSDRNRRERRLESS